MSATLGLAIVDSSEIVGHVVNHKLFAIGDWWVWSAIQTNIVLVGVIMVVLGSWLASKIASGAGEGNRRYLTSNPFAHMVEVMCVYLRDEMVRPLLGKRTDTFMPFLWTLFFFILLNNLFGLVPLLDLNHLLIPSMKHAHTAFIGGTATQSIYVTGILAVIAAVVFNIAGIKDLGIKGYLEHQTGGVPLKPAFLPIIALVFLIEVVSNLGIKPVALAIRLFANMTAGHILLATLLALAGLLQKPEIGPVIGGVSWVAATIASVAIMFLELFVAFMQAFIFFFLTAVFISLLSHHDEEHDDHGEFVEDHTPAPAGA